MSKDNTTYKVRHEEDCPEQITSPNTFCKDIRNGKGQNVDEYYRYNCVQGCIPESMEERWILKYTDVVCKAYPFDFGRDPEFTE